MTWLEDYDPTPSGGYELQVDFGPPSLSRAVALAVFFVVFAFGVWWAATTMHSGLPTGKETIMVRASPSAEGSPGEVSLPQKAEPVLEAPAAETAPPISLTDSERHFLRAEQLYDAKDFEAAAKELREGLALEPENISQRAMLAMVLSYGGSWAESAEEYTKVIDEHPDDALLHLGLGVALYKQEKIPEAIASLDRALELDPKLDEADRMLELLHREPEADIERVWFEHNDNVKGWDGFWTHIALTTRYWTGDKGTVRTLFFNEKGGELAGTFSNMVQADGQAAIEVHIKPPHRTTRFKDRVFFPYKGLRLGEGDHLVKVEVELLGPEERVIATRWNSLRLEVLRTAFGGEIVEARSSNIPETKTQ